jgi:1-acyl-sn-glycerol-3-phosphate acyltransferase
VLDEAGGVRQASAVSFLRDPGVLVVGPNVQRAHGRLAAAAARLAMRLTGWRFEGAVPDVAKMVLIVAPHTSNWDFPIGLQAKLALQMGCVFVGKHTLFRWPLGIFMRWLGGVPVNRAAASGFVEDVVRRLREADRMTVVIAPEGTRKRVDSWKSGFYRIAVEAGVPILPVAFDYPRRAIVFAPLFHPTGGYEKDLPALRALYRPEMGLRPENYA